MVPTEMQQLNELTQTITVVFLLTIAVMTLWRKWSDERRAREDDAKRYDDQLDELRKEHDRRCQEMMSEYLDDMRRLAGTREAAWGVQQVKRQGSGDETRHLSPFPSESGS